MLSLIGVQMAVSPHATQVVYNWPDKKRSRRLIKKLTKLRGPQITTKPCAYRMADGRMVIHPSLFAALQKGGDA